MSLVPLVSQSLGLGLSLHLIVQPRGKILVDPDRSTVVHNTMVTVRESKHLHLLRRHTRSHEEINHGSSVLVVHVVVTGAVKNTELAGDVLEARYIVHGRLEVSLLVLVQCLHVTLSVHGVIESPVRHRGGDETEAKDTRVRFNGLGCKVTAVRPSPHTDLLGVDIIKHGSKLLSSPDLIERLKLAKLRSHHGTVLATTHSSSTVVNSVDNVLELRVG
ncbi:hypothetical protein HG531_010796 [Fusarium graminearum]|nr:hypothetical protein HG531_010796 [Fusarium graminearum]